MKTAEELAKENWDKNKNSYSGHVYEQNMSSAFIAGYDKANEWISVKDRPLFIQANLGWECTEDGENEFIAAVPYTDSRYPEKELWWIHHCVIEDGTGLCIVGDYYTEPAGWELDSVTHWKPMPEPPKNN